MWGVCERVMKRSECVLHEQRMMAHSGMTEQLGFSAWEFSIGLQLGNSAREFSLWIQLGNLARELSLANQLGNSDLVFSV